MTSENIASFSQAGSEGGAGAMRTAARRDQFFYKVSKSGERTIVDAPMLEMAASDAHTHLHLLKDPELALARAACHQVGFICDVYDIVEDGGIISHDEWKRIEHSASRLALQMAGHC